MKVTLSELSPIKRSMEVVVDADTVEQAYAKAFKEALKMLSLPGFRRGKVPAYMGRKYIPNQMLKRDVLETIIPRSFSEAAEQEKVEVVSQPEFTKVSGERGEELTFTAEFEVIPTIELKDYEGVEVEQERYEPTEEDIDSTIERTRAGHAVLQNVEDRGLKAEDIAYVDYESFEDGKPVKDGEAKDFPMELSPDRYIPGFLENLYGMKPGETREFDAEFPADHKSPIAGHKIHFVFHLKEIKERVLPEVNAEFIKEISNSQFDNIEDLRKNIADLMKERIQAEANQGIAEKVYYAIAGQVPTELVPRNLSAYHARVFNNRVINNLAADGRKLEQMLEEQGRSIEDWQKHINLMGFGEARLEILVKNLARLLGTEVSEEEVNTVIDEEAKRARQTASSLKRRMEQAGTLGMLRYSILRDKVTQHLVDTAKVTYVAPKTPEERAAEAAAKKAAEEAAKEEAEPKAEVATEEKTEDKAE
ncbi:MAG: trigger factor [Candidatus Bruticola sp.]